MFNTAFKYLHSKYSLDNEYHILFGMEGGGGEFKPTLKITQILTTLNFTTNSVEVDIAPA